VRTSPVPQTFSSLMCWAATDRMARLARRHRPALADEFTGEAARIKAEILEEGWSESLGGLTSTYQGSELDAALLQAANLHFFDPDEARARSAVMAVHRELDRGGFLLRYANDDGFGVPESAFLICNFWLVEAMARVGLMDEAQDVFRKTLRALSPLGLLSEDYDVRTGRLWGNFPQAYSHVGLIHAAFACSPSWERHL
jgi:GH15 family glucan-1,4-alpha-glucosidase